MEKANRLYSGIYQEILRLKKLEQELVQSDRYTNLDITTAIRRTLENIIGQH